MARDDKSKTGSGRIAKDSDRFGKRNETIIGNDSNKPSSKPNQGDANKDKKPGQAPFEVKSRDE